MGGVYRYLDDGSVDGDECLGMACSMATARSMKESSIGFVLSVAEVMDLTALARVSRVVEMVVREVRSGSSPCCWWLLCPRFRLSALVTAVRGRRRETRLRRATIVGGLSLIYFTMRVWLIWESKVKSIASDFQRRNHKKSIGADLYLRLVIRVRQYLTFVLSCFLPIRHLVGRL